MALRKETAAWQVVHLVQCQCTDDHKTDVRCSGVLHQHAGTCFAKKHMRSILPRVLPVMSYRYYQQNNSTLSLMRRVAIGLGGEKCGSTM